MSNNKYIGILVAMDEELEGILNLMKNKEEHYRGDTLFHIGRISTNNVVIAKSGVGKVNAARTTMIMHYEYNLEKVINIGVAGSINPNLSIGDIVIGIENVQYDFDITAFNHKKGYIPGVGDTIKSDELLVKWVEEKIGSRLGNVKSGMVSTGDRFCTDVKDKYEIYREFDAMAVDMEGASVAQICYLNKMPFVTIKSISDSPSGNNEIEYENNLDYACARCADVIGILLESEEEK